MKKNFLKLALLLLLLALALCITACGGFSSSDDSDDKGPSNADKPANIEKYNTAVTTDYIPNLYYASGSPFPEIYIVSYNRDGNILSYEPYAFLPVGDDESAEALHYAYDGVGRLLSITDSEGCVYQVHEYDANGNAVFAVAEYFDFYFKEYLTKSVYFTYSKDGVLQKEDWVADDRTVTYTEDGKLQAQIEFSPYQYNSIEKREFQYPDEQTVHSVYYCNCLPPYYNDINVTSTVVCNEKGLFSSYSLKVPSGQEYYRLTMQYDENDKASVLSMTVFEEEPLSFTVNFSYDSTGKVSEINAYQGELRDSTIQFEYDEQGLLIRNASLYYDDNELIRSKDVLKYEYDAQKRLTQKTDLTYSYDTLSSKTVYQYELDSAGNLITECTLSYNGSFLSSKEVTQLEYDSKNQKVKEITLHYDGYGNLTYKFGYQYEYNAQNKISKAFYLRYDDDGILLKTDPRSEFTYTAEGRLESTTDFWFYHSSLPEKTVEKYDKYGNVISQTTTHAPSSDDSSYSLIDENVYTYDNRGNLLQDISTSIRKDLATNKTMYFNKSIRKSEYNEQGLKVSEVYTDYDENNVLESKSKKEYQYNKEGQLTKEIDFYFDNNGEPSGREETTYEYNELHLEILQSTVRYDAVGKTSERQVTITARDENGSAIRETYRKYDASGALIEERIHDY